MCDPGRNRSYRKTDPEALYLQGIPFQGECAKELGFIFPEPENTGSSEKTLDVSANINNV